MNNVKPSLPLSLFNSLTLESLCSVVTVITSAMGSRFTFGRVVEAGITLRGDEAITAPDLSRSVTVDWGTGRGQGKRIGGGAVRGSMSCLPRGVRTYVDRIGALPPDEYEEARLLRLTDTGLEDYLAARHMGESHADAMVYAYASMPAETPSPQVVAFAYAFGERLARRYTAVATASDHLAAWNVDGPVATVPELRAAFTAGFMTRRTPAATGDTVITTPAASPPENILPAPLDNAYRQAYIAPHERSSTHHEKRRNHLHRSRSPHRSPRRNRVSAPPRRMRHLRNVDAPMLDRRNAQEGAQPLPGHLPHGPQRRRAVIVGSSSGSDPPSSHHAPLTRCTMEKRR